MLDRCEASTVFILKMDTNLTKCEAILPKVRVHPTIWWQENIKLSKVIHTCYHDNRPNTDHTRLDTHTRTQTHKIYRHIYSSNSLYYYLSRTRDQSKWGMWVFLSFSSYACDTVRTTICSIVPYDLRKSLYLTCTKVPIIRSERPPQT